MIGIWPHIHIPVIINKYTFSVVLVLLVCHAMPKPRQKAKPR